VDLDPRALPPLRSRRFRLERVIGTGGMGVVYEAVDEERGGRVALKTLRALDAEARTRFKNEFRKLQDIHHPNLVSLGELLEDDGRLFFTMELVSGKHLLAHVRPGSGQRRPAPRVWRRADSSTAPMDQPARDPSAPWLLRDGEVFDEAKIRASFAQLVRGLSALHRASRVHRDVKPSNVLVTDAGRVVIVDFGLILDVERDERDASVVGTAHYMAPEQALGGPVGPAADAYAVGVMLYMALTGYFPFRVAPEQSIAVKLRSKPVRPRELVSDPLPADLEELCVALLAIEPAARPRAAEILRALGAAADTEPEEIARSGFVGRRAELATLSAALDEVRAGAAVGVQIEGESGLGKSALLRRFLDAEAGAVVLYGRCYERESVPYKAVDEVIEALSRHLARLSPGDVSRLLPPDASLLALAFPSLGRLDAVASAAAAREAPDPRESRAQVFAALRELLRRLSAHALLIVGIDDLQWADADSLALLAEVLRGPDPPRLLFLCTSRGGALLPRDRVRRLPLGPLSAEDAAALARELLARVGGALSIEPLIAEAGGHPLLLDALLRHRLAAGGEGPVRLLDALRARADRLDTPARQLLEAIAVAGRPVARSVAARAVGVALPELGRLEATLRGAELVRSSGVGDADEIEPFHDRVREAVLSALDPVARRAHHARLGLSLEAGGSAEPEALATHFREAGDAPRAARYAALAGDAAAAALAFDRAARLYRAALDQGPPPAVGARALQVELGAALGNAGRGAEAAAAYLAAIDASAPAGGVAVDALELRRRAAENYLRSGYFDEGMASLRAVLAAVGMRVPATPSAALAMLLARRAQLRLRGLSFREQPESAVPPEKLHRIDVCWSAALGLGMIDNVRGAYFQASNLLLALDAGEPYRIARALALEVPFVAVPGLAARPRALELLAAADTLARRTGHPHALALVRLVSGTSLYLAGRFPEAVAELDRAESILRERCTGVPWERGSGATIGLWCRFFTGDLREFCRRVPAAIREAEERGDRYVATNLRSYFTNAHWLLQGDPAGARREAAQAIEGWSKAGFHLQHLHDVVARGQIALYEGDPAEAHAVLGGSWSRLASSLSLRLQTARVYAVHLRARAALALAAEARGPLGLARRASLLLEASRAARALDGEGAPWAAHLAELLRGGAAAVMGRDEAAVAAFGRAAQGFRVEGMELFAAVARLREGQLLGDARGAALAAEAERWMLGQGVAEPDRVAAMLAPAG
jgi:hypothetical protein